MQGLPRQILQDLVDAGGSIETHKLQPAHPSRSNRISELLAQGLIVKEYRITDEGRARMDAPRKMHHMVRKAAGLDAARAMNESAFDALSSAWRGPYPIATTDEQIEKLKEQAEADRSFGFESINGREARK